MKNKFITPSICGMSVKSAFMLIFITTTAMAFAQEQSLVGTWERLITSTSSLGEFKQKAVITYYSDGTGIYEDTNITKREGSSFSFTWTTKGNSITEVGTAPRPVTRTFAISGDTLTLSPGLSYTRTQPEPAWDPNPPSPVGTWRYYDYGESSYIGYIFNADGTGTRIYNSGSYVMDIKWTRSGNKITIVRSNFTEDYTYRIIGNTLTLRFEDSRNKSSTFTEYTRQ